MELTLQPGFAGIAFGLSRQLGASPKTQLAIAGTVAAIDGIAAARAGMPRRLAAESAVPLRPSWRASELDVGARIEGQGYRAQVSFKDGVEVPYGTKGSARPEYYNPGSSIEVKNYSVETARGRSNLVRNVSGQAVDRARNLPPGTAQNVYIDVRGQNVSRTDLNAIISRIVQRSNGAVQPSNINIVR
ncbi:hypothetical protein [Sphingobium sp. MK2]|uniref:hypothetical protein n=1 Tax=Sphingobium sp. MK2 TaxID=3116540 RepID=UPI0032E36743